MIERRRAKRAAIASFRFLPTEDEPLKQVAAVFLTSGLV